MIASYLQSLDAGKRKKFVEGMDDYPELPVSSLLRGHQVAAYFLFSSQPKAFFRINAERFHIRWRGEVSRAPRSFDDLD